MSDWNGSTSGPTTCQLGSGGGGGDGRRRRRCRRRRDDNDGDEPNERKFSR